jgi:hypothetical protein
MCTTCSSRAARSTEAYSELADYPLVEDCEVFDCRQNVGIDIGSGNHNIIRNNHVQSRQHAQRQQVVR